MKNCSSLSFIQNKITLVVPQTVDTPQLSEVEQPWGTIPDTREGKVVLFVGSIDHDSSLNLKAAGQLLETV